MNPTLKSALAKLRWGSQQKDWSVDLNASECTAILEAFSPRNSSKQKRPADAPASRKPQRRNSRA